MYAGTRTLYGLIEHLVKKGFNVNYVWEPNNEKVIIDCKHDDLDYKQQDYSEVYSQRMFDQAVDFLISIADENKNINLIRSRALNARCARYTLKPVFYLEFKIPAKVQQKSYRGDYIDRNGNLLIRTAGQTFINTSRYHEESELFKEYIENIETKGSERTSCKYDIENLLGNIPKEENMNDELNRLLVTLFLTESINRGLMIHTGPIIRNHEHDRMIRLITKHDKVYKINYTELIFQAVNKLCTEIELEKNGEVKLQSLYLTERRTVGIDSKTNDIVCGYIYE